jgi:glycine/D-amino acid oxidase-like deaminating enzyme
LKSELITMSRVRELLPGVHGSWSLALHTASDGHANPVLATSALARSAVKNGAVLVTGSTVEEIEVSGGAVAGVRTSQGYIRTSTVVLAAGIWSSRIAGRLGVRLPQGIVTNSVAATQPVPRLTDLGVWTRELSFRQLSDGRLLLSAETATEVDVFLNEPMNARMFMPVYLHNRRTFKMQFHRVGTLRRRRGMRHFRLPEARPNLAQLSSVASAMRRAFPQLADLRLERAWAGHIDGTPDGLAMIGRTGEVDGLVVATGFTGHGFALGPAAGRLVAGLLTGEDMGLDIDQFRPGRFRDGVRSAPRSLL